MELECNKLAQLITSCLNKSSRKDLSLLTNKDNLKDLISEAIKALQYQQKTISMLKAKLEATQAKGHELIKRQEWLERRVQLEQSEWRFPNFELQPVSTPKIAGSSADHKPPGAFSLQLHQETPTPKPKTVKLVSENEKLKKKITNLEMEMQESEIKVLLLRSMAESAMTIMRMKERPKELQSVNITPFSKPGITDRKLVTPNMSEDQPSNSDRQKENQIKSESKEQVSIFRFKVSRRSSANTSALDQPSYVDENTNSNITTMMERLKPVGTQSVDRLKKLNERIEKEKERERSLTRFPKVNNDRIDEIEEELVSNTSPKNPIQMTSPVKKVLKIICPSSKCKQYGHTNEDCRLKLRLPNISKEEFERKVQNVRPRTNNRK
eukprot:TRINITY_DN22366_c0_g1_i1.p1 TRINITY_DN22366_c0_g1~~TRINITY_DN22366_c0_g1_i1.p1  ORF type:complete len:381 (+),score=61.11 TRINITY_DN22366_c0_g1_i1:188-1330(+)